MNEALKKFATKLTGHEFENMSAYTFSKLAGNRKNVDVAEIICEALKDENIVISAENDGIYIMNMQDVEDRLNNRIWLEDRVMPAVRTAKAKEVNFTRGECKHQVEIGTEEAKKHGLSGIPGRTYCWMWKRQVESVVQINGKCVPTEYLTQSVPDSGENQFGADGKSEGKPIGNIKATAGLKKKAEDEEGVDEQAVLEGADMPQLLPKVQQLKEMSESEDPRLREAFNLMYGMNPDEKFQVLQLNLYGRAFHGELLKALKDDPEKVTRIIEEHMVDYGTINKEAPQAFETYFSTIKEDDAKVYNIFSDDSVKALGQTYTNMLKGYHQAIAGDPERILKFLESGIVEKHNEALKDFEASYLKFIADNEEQIRGALNSDLFEHVKKDAQKALYNMIADDEEAVDQALADGILDEEAIGDDRIFHMISKRYQDEDQLLALIQNDRVQNYKIWQYLKSQNYDINEVKNDELQTALIEKVYNEDETTLNKWVTQTTNMELRAKLLHVLGDAYERKYKYRDTEPEQMFDDTRETSQWREDLQRLKMPISKNLEIIRQVEIMMNKEGVSEYPWSDFKRNYPKITSKYPDVLSAIRNNGPKITKEFINDVKQKLEQTAKYPVTFQDMTQLRGTQQTISEDLYLAIQINMPEEYMNYIDQEENPYATAYWIYLHGQHGTTGMHPMEYNTLGWARVDLVRPETTASYVMLEELQSDVLDTFAHSNITEVMQKAIESAGIEYQLEQDEKDINQVTEEVYNLFMNEWNLKEWRHWAVHKVFEWARGAGAEFVVIPRGDYKRSQTGITNETAIRQYYEDTPKEYGFRDAEGNELVIPGADLESFWIRKAENLKEEKVVVSSFKLNNTGRILTAGYNQNGFDKEMKFDYNKVPESLTIEGMKDIVAKNAHVLREREYKFLTAGLTQEAAGEIDNIRKRFEQDVQTVQDKVGLAHRFLAKVKQMLGPQATQEAMQKWTTWAGDLIGEKNLAVAASFIVATTFPMPYGLTKEAAGELDNIRKRFEQDLGTASDKVGLAHRFLAKLKQMLQKAGRFSDQVFQNWVSWAGQKIGKPNLGVAASKKKKKESNPSRLDRISPKPALPPKPWKKKSSVCPECNGYGFSHRTGSCGHCNGLGVVTAKEVEDKLPGGLADGQPDDRYPEDQIEKGKKVEREHSTDPQVQKEIAKDHLEEDKQKGIKDPDYYDRLENIDPHPAQHKESSLSDSDTLIRTAEYITQMAVDNKKKRNPFPKEPKRSKVVQDLAEGLKDLSESSRDALLEYLESSDEEERERTASHLARLGRLSKKFAEDQGGAQQANQTFDLSIDIKKKMGDWKRTIQQALQMLSAIFVQTRKKRVDLSKFLKPTQSASGGELAYTLTLPNITEDEKDSLTSTVYSKIMQLPAVGKFVSFDVDEGAGAAW